MTTFLTLCQRVRQECGVAGDGPAAVTNQTGAYKKIVDRTSRAWVDIQRMPYWKFMRKQASFPLIVGQRVYSVRTDCLVTDLSKWDRDSAFVYKDSIQDETTLQWPDYQKFRRAYRSYNPGRPCVITDSVRDSIEFDTIPDFAYRATLDYWKTPVVLAANADEPDIPFEYQDIIVWKSMTLFAGNEIAPELYAHGKKEYEDALHQLFMDQMSVPTQRRSFPLAGGNANASPGFGWRR